jgi:hypothetical protein
MGVNLVFHDKRRTQFPRSVFETKGRSGGRVKKITQFVS